MRQILFRGKRIDNGEWVVGDLTGGCVIHTQPPYTDGEGGYEWWGYPVDPETLGQFTGLTDKTGTKIFEGDVIVDVDKNRYEVLFYYGQFKAAAFPNKIRLYNISAPFAEPNFEVTGNIHNK